MSDLKPVYIDSDPRMLLDSDRKWATFLLVGNLEGKPGSGKVKYYPEHEIESLREKLKEAEKVIEFYAALPNNKFKTAWENCHVCDSYSGALSTFDWDGSLQDDAWDMARNYLNRKDG